MISRSPETFIHLLGKQQKTEYSLSVAKKRVIAANLEIIQYKGMWRHG